MRLCLALGVAHPDYLGLTTSQVADWLAFARVEPFGPEADGTRLAYAVAPLLQSWGSKVSWEELMPYRQKAALGPLAAKFEQYKKQRSQLGHNP